MIFLVISHLYPNLNVLIPDMIKPVDLFIISFLWIASLLIYYELMIIRREKRLVTVIDKIDKYVYKRGPLLCVITTFKPTKEHLKHLAYKNTANLYYSMKNEITAFLAVKDDPLSVKIWLHSGHTVDTLIDDIKTNEYGTPFVSSLFQNVEDRCPKETRFVSYANGDILFGYGGLVNTLNLMKNWSIANNNSLDIMIVGQRSNHMLEGNISSDDVDNLDSSLFQKNAQDYFILSRQFTFDLPTFVIGRRAYDNALVDWAHHNAVLVDASDTIKAVHQTTADGNYAGHSDQNMDKEFNVLLPNVFYDHGETTHAHYRTVKTRSDMFIVSINDSKRVFSISI